MSTRIDPRASEAGHRVGQLQEGALPWTAVGTEPPRPGQGPGQACRCNPRLLPEYFFSLSSGRWAVCPRLLELSLLGEGIGLV